MKVAFARLATAALLAVLLTLLSSASGTKGPLLQPTKFIILSTTDVKGKTGPCG